MFGSTGLLIFLPAALAACLIVACPLKRWTRRATATVSSSIWPEWLPRPAESTALAFVEESPLLQPLPASQPELLLIIPVSVPSPGIVAQALTGVAGEGQPFQQAVHDRQRGPQGQLCLYFQRRRARHFSARTVTLGGIEAWP